MIRKCYSAFPKAQRIEPRIIRNRWGPNVTFFQFRSLRFSRRRRIRWRTASGSPFLYMGCRCFCLKTSVSTLSEGSKPFWPQIALFWTMFYLVRTVWLHSFTFVLVCRVKTRLFAWQENMKQVLKVIKYNLLLIENKLILKVLCIMMHFFHKKIKIYVICDWEMWEYRSVRPSEKGTSECCHDPPVCKYFSPAAALQITPMECVSLQLFRAQTSRFSLTSTPPTRKTARSSQMTCGSPSQRCRRWRSTE